MRRVLLPIVAAVLAVQGLSGARSEAAAPRTADVSIIQAVPGSQVDVAIDDETVARGATVGDVLGPFDLAAGEHAIQFTPAEGPVVSSMLEVEAGRSSDVVLHLPADVGGDPVIHAYDAPTDRIGPDKARVVLAHTATVAPADVAVNGDVVFTNIANGEFAEADVPAGRHQVALLPTGSSQNPILGPVDVALGAGTLSMIYAYGNPRDGSMNVIAHTSTLRSDGSAAPSRIDTGSAGLVRDPVDAFGPGEPTMRPWFAAPAALTAAGVLALAAWRRPRRDRAVQTPR